MLSDSDLFRVQNATAGLTEPVSLVVANPASDVLFDKDLVNTARQIAGVSWGRIAIEEDTADVIQGKTSITLAAGAQRNIHYLATPQGLELAPFLDAITWLGKAAPMPTSDVLQRLDALDESVSILALVTAACPHCPEVVSKLLAAATYAPLLVVTVIDAVAHGDFASRYKVKATPTVIFNDRATLVGEITEAQIVDEVLRKNTDSSLTEIVASMIKAGRAEDAAQLMVRDRKPAAILPIYRSPELALRIGALVTMEEALGMDPRSLDPIIDELCALLTNKDARLRGDTADILGKIGNLRAEPALRSLLDDTDPDVVDAATDALESLKQ